MDIEKTLKLIEGKIQEIPALRWPCFDYKKNDEEVHLWINDTLYIVEDGFGRDSPEYKRVANSSRRTRVIDTSKQREINMQCLDSCESALQSILRNYEGEDFTSVTSTPTEGTLTPKVFIAHGKDSLALTKLCRFLTQISIDPLVVEDKPSEGRAVDDKVDFYLNQSDCAIILATGDDQIDGKIHPRQNVIHEIGSAQRIFPRKIIYLLEGGTEFPSNISPKVWQSFNQECMEEAFITIARELIAFGLLKSVKPEQ